MTQLPDKPDFSFDTVKAAYRKAFGNRRFAMPPDQEIHKVYHGMVARYPWIVDHQRTQERTRHERELIDKRNRLRAELIEADQQIREERLKAGDDIARLGVQEIDQHLALDSATLPMRQLDPDDSNATLDLRQRWHWVWQVWPAEIEASIRSTNPGFPYPTTRGKGRTEPEASVVATIMHELMEDFTGDLHNSAKAIDRDLQKLKAEKAREPTASTASPLRRLLHRWTRVYSE